MSKIVDNNELNTSIFAKKNSQKKKFIEKF